MVFVLFIYVLKVEWFKYVHLKKCELFQIFKVPFIYGGMNVRKHKGGSIMKDSFSDHFLLHVNYFYCSLCMTASQFCDSRKDYKKHYLEINLLQIHTVCICATIWLYIKNSQTFYTLISVGHVTCSSLVLLSAARVQCAWLPYVGYDLFSNSHYSYFM